ncbi:unnamed protein product [Mycena citricolor]|uniref:Uncharacterized protein n=1 Tax=Mycena citricolor TaxID=2018698 RepID=A0AAD2K135_9AGAR|nr:unnamed protein product [Mycena citricolor]CAK5273060.1 unnamed protein product [Mycena citricolor]CAK5273069.1 unnamed protein product [Mycena citricolor]CAK5273072.1 unnamed protein product [Mycena citricolor]CAK5273082.1 unnamed protein product [Mycena citricolor]
MRKQSFDSGNSQDCSSCYAVRPLRSAVKARRGSAACWRRTKFF